jgi:hypothetical protein
MTDPAALLTRLHEAKQTRDVWQIGLAEQALEHAAPDLAARVLELEAENKRLREGLDLASHRLNAAAVFAGSHAPNREMYEFGEWFKEARTALKGGEI